MKKVMVKICLTIGYAVVGLTLGQILDLPTGVLCFVGICYIMADRTLSNVIKVN